MADKARSLTTVSAADEAANAVIMRGLSRLFSGLPIVSEEETERKTSAPDACFALIDPLDGTREFLAGRDEFTVNIAIVRDGRPDSSLRRPSLSSGTARPNCEWDVAAGHAIVAAAGGAVTTPDGAELVYGRTDDLHIPGFIAWGDARAAQDFFNVQ